MTFGIALAELGNYPSGVSPSLSWGGLPEFLCGQSRFELRFYDTTACCRVYGKPGNKMYCYAASSDSIVSSNGQEDHVSMGANVATKLYRIMGHPT